MTHAGPTVSLTPAASDFVAAVVALQPRLAVFDCDGTLWAGDSGAEFLYWELDQGLLPEPVAAWIRPRYRDYLDGKVSEEAICGEMVTIHEGLRTADLERAADEFFTRKFTSAIFPEMQELTHRLRDAGCELWAVSSTNDWVVCAGVRHFGIPEEHVLAACVYSVGGTATGVLQRVPTGPDKARAIHDRINRIPDVAFGNSIHDAAMLLLSRHPYAVNPNPELLAIAHQHNWPVYYPIGTKP
ncbi:MAG: HAD family hydrolase [Terriglobales bacterium]